MSRVSEGVRRNPILGITAFILLALVCYALAGVAVDKLTAMFDYPMSDSLTTRAIVALTLFAVLSRAGR